MTTRIKRPPYPPRKQSRAHPVPKTLVFRDEIDLDQVCSFKLEGDMVDIRLHSVNSGDMTATLTIDETRELWRWCMNAILAATGKPVG